MKDNPNDYILFENIFDASHEGILVVDQQGAIIKANTATENMFGYSTGELLGKKVEILIPKELRKTHIQHRARNSKNPKSRPMGAEMDLWGLKKDGHKFPLQISLSPSVYRNENVTIAYIGDTMNSRLTEQELRSKEAKNKALLDAMPDIMVIQNYAGDIVDFYAPEDTVVNVPKEKIIGKNIKEIVPSKTSDMILQAHEEVIKTKNIQIREYTLALHNKQVELESRTVPLNNHSLLTIVRDITETKAIQDVLNVRNSALEAAGNSIIIVDAQLPDLPVIYCNDAFCNLTGYERKEVLGKNCRFLQNNDRNQEELKIIRNCIKSQKTSRTVLRNYRKDGSLFYNELTITPVLNEQGQLTHFIGVQNNVTERITEALIKDQMRQILEMIAKHDALDKIGETIIDIIEGHLSNAIAFIFMLDPKKKTLHKLVAPNLPKGFCHIIDDVPIGPEIGSYGVAAHLKKEVIVTDLTTNPLWADCQKAALKHGFNSCWSYPIFSSNQKVLGTFGIYGKEPKKPSKADKDIIDGIIQLISIALEEHHVREQLNKSHWLLEDYARELEKTVNERTNELKATVQKMIEANLNLEDQIKETKDAENRALESQAMFTAIAKNFPKGVIIVFNTDFDIVYIDGGEMYRMGLDKNKFEGKCIDDIDVFSKQRLSQIKEDIKKTMKGEHLTFETKFRNKYFTVNTSPLMGGDDEVKWTLFVYNDITKMKQAETEIRKALIREQELNELKSRFIAMASHEFRTPLSAIHSSAILIEKQNTAGKEAKREKYVNQIKQNVRGLVVILNDFLSLSKLEEGRVRPNPENIELVAFAKRVVSEIEPNRKRGQRIKIASNKKSINAYLDPKLMQHILTNLLSNAIKYSDNDQEIFVTLELDNQSTSIRVKDQGIGIPKIEQDKLFQRFFRADNSTNIQGTGLGLNIVKQYTELMGGTVGLESEQDKGSTFWVTFPRIQQPQVSNAEAD